MTFMALYIHYIDATSITAIYMILQSVIFPMTNVSLHSMGCPNLHLSAFQSSVYFVLNKNSEIITTFQIE